MKIENIDVFSFTLKKVFPENDFVVANCGDIFFINISIKKMFIGSLKFEKKDNLFEYKYLRCCKMATIRYEKDFDVLFQIERWIFFNKKIDVESLVNKAKEEVNQRNIVKEQWRKENPLPIKYNKHKEVWESPKRPKLNTDWFYTFTRLVKETA